MQLVTMKRDMRPYQGGHDYALPDAAAEQLIAAGDAVQAAGHQASGLQPDAADPRPRNRYLTRGKG